MTKCIIFGGNGFIGSHLAQRLVKDGYKVCVFDEFKGGINDRIRKYNDKIELLKGNFFDEKDVRNALIDVDYVFHYISTTNPSTSIADPIYDIESNVIGSIKLFQICTEKDIAKVIFSSSGGTIYGEPLKIPAKEDDPTNPINPYAIGKQTIERYLNYFNKAYGLDYTILRYSNPYGAGQNPYGKQGVISIFLNKIKQHENPVIYGDGTMMRDYIYIGDLINATSAMLGKKLNYNLFNVGSGIGTSLNEIIQIISDVSGKDVSPVYMENSSGYISKIILDISRIKRETCWKPTVDLHDGIKETWNWINSL